MLDNSPPRGASSRHDLEARRPSQGGAPSREVMPWPPASLPQRPQRAQRPLAARGEAEEQDGVAADVPRGAGPARSARSALGVGPNRGPDAPRAAGVRENHAACHAPSPSAVPRLGRTGSLRGERIRKCRTFLVVTKHTCCIFRCGKIPVTW